MHLPSFSASPFLPKRSAKVETFPLPCNTYRLNFSYAFANSLIVQQKKFKSKANNLHQQVFETS
ncbi:hypothetical protein C7T94_00005 [Pedobacter yulinensis]|uniref:Uncharacterized protein n=1 Tax=Pedobacter yulinensis TaxID=2126353 RepID=A0A2T3HQ91_9SPHI|nr:hypothetical protein C7T94_00005 [Pedobacter yulinensis]